MNFKAFMELIQHNPTHFRKVVEEAFEQRKSPRDMFQGYTPEDERVSVHFSFCNDAHHSLCYISYDDLAEVYEQDPNGEFMAEEPQPQPPEVKSVVLTKSQVAAMARMFNDGAYRVQLEHSNTSIGVHIQATPLNARGFEYEAGNKVDISDYENW